MDGRAKDQTAADAQAPGSGSGGPATAVTGGQSSVHSGAVDSLAVAQAAGVPASGPPGTVTTVKDPGHPASGVPLGDPAKSAAGQLAMHMTPLRLDADGVHRLTVQLHPADLGPVQVVAEIRDGAISVRLSGSTGAGTDALRQGLPDLRRELHDAGFTNCTLDLRDSSAGQQQTAHQQAAHQQQTAHHHRAAQQQASGRVAEPVPGAPGSTSLAGRLDVRA